MINFIEARKAKWKRSLRKRLAALRLVRAPQSNSARCVIVASNGRAGSTMTYKVLLNSLRIQHPEAAGQTKFVARLGEAEFKAPALFKTHDYPDALSSWPKDTRVVFCFGSAKDSAYSVYSQKENVGDAWINQHFYHLHAIGGFDELHKRDVLQQARQIKQWATFSDVPVLCIHYDALWEHQETISQFTGLKFVAPDRHERTPKEIPAEFRVAASKTYDPIDAVVAQLPKCFLASPDYQSIVDKLPMTD